MRNKINNLIKEYINLFSLYDELKNHGGFSYSLGLGDISKTNNIVVSLEFEEKKSIDISRQEFDFWLKEYIKKHSDLLLNKKNVIGAWIFENEIYLDISELFPYNQENKKEVISKAIKVGKKRNQKAIFDLGEMKEIKIKQ